VSGRRPLEQYGSSFDAPTSKIPEKNRGGRYLLQRWSARYLPPFISLPKTRASPWLSDIWCLFRNLDSIYHHLFHILRISNMPKSSIKNYYLQDFEDAAATGVNLTCASRYNVNPRESEAPKSFWTYTPSRQKKKTAVPESRKDDHDTVTHTFCDQLTAGKSRATELTEHDDFLGSEAAYFNQTKAAKDSVLWAGHTKLVQGRMAFKILVADRKAHPSEKSCCTM
jgi:hypothetical protein